MRNASSHSVKRYAWFAVLLVFGIRPLPSATLQQLTMDDMIAQSDRHRPGHGGGLLGGAHRFGHLYAL